MIKFLRETAKAFSIGVLVFLIRGIFMLANGTTLDFNQDLALEFFYNQLFAVCLYLANAYFVTFMMNKYKQDLFKLNHLLVALLSSISISLATIFILRFLIIVYGYNQDATSFLQNEKMVFYWMSLTISVVITAIFYTVYYIKSKQDTKVKEQKVIAGTAWVFANELMWDELDYLFVDEAGQVSLANLVGMSRSTKNIILMGDQMQLGQPTQGVHPDGTGSSSLDYLLGELPTIPKDIGMLLPETYRLHPDICKFVSTRVYEGRLRHVSITEKRKLILGINSSITKSSGILYVPVNHFGNEQSSEEEILAIKELIKDLMQAKKTDIKGVKSPVTPQDLLIVAPYNHQVRNLQDGLGHKFNIGTVDKFQGREAPVVIISMTASDIESAPRGAEFLMEKNRLNVAISRAQSLAIVVASSSLNTPRARSVKEMSLINFYMDLIEYAC